METATPDGPSAQTAAYLGVAGRSHSLLGCNAADAAADAADSAADAGLREAGRGEAEGLEAWARWRLHPDE